MCLKLHQKKEAPYLGQGSDEQLFFVRNEKKQGYNLEHPDEERKFLLKL